MTHPLHFRARLSDVFSDQGAQLVEFAVSLPLLVVFVVGIFDFSSAFTLRLRLTNLARDAARAAAGDPASDLQNTTPVSVSDAFYLIDNYLQANNINDCGISSTPTPQPPLTWTFSANGNGCPAAGLTITVNRGYYFPRTGAVVPSVGCQPQNPGTTAVIGTCVSIQYPYPWRFGKAAGLLGRNASLPTQISTVAVALNEN